MHNKEILEKFKSIKADRGTFFLTNVWTHFSTKWEDSFLGSNEFI